MSLMVDTRLASMACRVGRNGEGDDSRPGRGPSGSVSGPGVSPPRCAKLLLEAGATVNVAARDSEVTPLHVAAARGLEEHVALYLEHGAHVYLRTSQGETALNAACAGAEGPASGGRHQAAARRLLAAGADARAAGRKRHTPLHNACANGCGALAELLLRHGACAGAPNAAGHTPLDCALLAVQDAPRWEPEGLLAALLDYGAQPVSPEVRGEGARKEAPVERGSLRLELPCR